MRNRKDVRDTALHVLKHLKEINKGQGATDCGMGMECLYADYFGEPLPNGVTNRIETMCRCIIDGKPYAPEQVTGA